MKRLLRIGKYLGILFSALLLMLLLAVWINGVAPEAMQANPGTHIHKHLDPATYSLDSLRQRYGQNKVFPPELELQCLIALSYFPELRETRIEFILKNTLIPVASRPALMSYFGHADQRLYYVIISSGSRPSMEPILVENLPFDAQVGIIGHEIAHTAYYVDKSLMDVIEMGVCYPLPAYRSDFEKATDRRTVYYGLGWQLYHYAKFVRELPSIGEGTIEWLNRYYLTEKEIKALMESLPYYDM